VVVGGLPPGLEGGMKAFFSTILARWLSFDTELAHRNNLAHQLYSGRGADIVMESISLIDQRSKREMARLH
jgi:hypothetical protein